MNNNKTSAALYVVATPIGNLEDITLRALRILGEVDTIYAEDTRRTAKLLHHYEISKPLESYHSFNEHRKTAAILDRVANGQNIALVSDAGSPCIADPGFLLVREARERNIDVQIIPGVSSLTFAIAAAGLPADKFSFFAFLPVKAGKKATLLRRIMEEQRSAVVFESPYRMNKTLRAVCDEISPETKVAVIREATKIHEQVLCAEAGELFEEYKNHTWKGEIVLVIFPPPLESCANARNLSVRQE